jgi:hypothetical protein
METTLIVRTRHDDTGRPNGMGEAVGTGEKDRLRGLEALSRAVRTLLSTTVEGRWQ